MVFNNSKTVLDSLSPCIRAKLI